LYTLPTELSAPPYLFVDRARVFPVLATISSDIVGHATLTGATRDMELTSKLFVPLPNVERVPTVPELPEDLEEVSELPILTRVVPPAEP